MFKLKWLKRHYNPINEGFAYQHKSEKFFYAAYENMLYKVTEVEDSELIFKKISNTKPNWFPNYEE